MHECCLALSLNGAVSGILIAFPVVEVELNLRACLVCHPRAILVPHSMNLKERIGRLRVVRAIDVDSTRSRLSGGIIPGFSDVPILVKLKHNLTTGPGVQRW